MDQAGAMSPTEIEAIIREAAGEDRYGLYEIIWTLNARFPEIDEAAKIAASRPVLRDLLERGVVSIYAQPWAKPDVSAPLTMTDALEQITPDAAWRVGDVNLTFDLADGSHAT